MSDVPDQAVDRRLVHEMQRHGQFDHAQPGAEMAADLADGFDQVGAQFLGDGRKFGFGELAEIGGNGDAREARVTLGVHRDSGNVFSAAIVR